MDILNAKMLWSAVEGIRPQRFRSAAQVRADTLRLPLQASARSPIISAASITMKLPWNPRPLQAGLPALHLPYFQKTFWDLI